MPRDSNGAYSLPAGTLVSVGDTVLPSQHNPAMNDLASSMTGSLARSGAGGMLADLNLGGFSLTNTLNLSAAGTLSVAGAATFSAALTVNNNAGVNGNFAVSGTTALTGAVTTGGALNVGGALTVTGAITLNNNLGVNGNAAITGTTSLTGVVTTGGAINAGGQIRRDTTFYMDFAGANPILNFDGNDYLLYDRTNNKLSLIIGGVTVFSVDASGNGIFKGNVTAFGTP